VPNGCVNIVDSSKLIMSRQSLLFYVLMYKLYGLIVCNVRQEQFLEVVCCLHPEVVNEIYFLASCCEFSRTEL
jgi:hypothetical protein